MKHYTISRLPSSVQLVAQAEVIDKDQRGRSIGTHIETTTTSGYDIGNVEPKAQALAAAIMQHYYGADPGAQVEAKRRTVPFLNAFLIHQNLPTGGKLEISSDVIDRWMSLQV